MKQYIFREGHAQNISMYGQDSTLIKGEFVFEEGVPYMFTYLNTKKGKRYGFKRVTLWDYIKSVFTSTL